VEVPDHKWKVQSVDKVNNLVHMVGYIDSRQVTERLNTVLGVDGWSNVLEPAEGGIICNITVTMPDGSTMHKSDFGAISHLDKNIESKGTASDAIKRAAVLFGIGAYLYKLTPVKLQGKQKNNKIYPCDGKGNILVTGVEQTMYINGINSNLIKLTEIYKSLPAVEAKSLESEFKKIGEAIKK
jgi:hypothetical protein